MMEFPIFPEHMPAVVEKLRLKAQADSRARIQIDKLDVAHRETLIRAINNVLATENAVFTYAQIIDGLPTAEVGYDEMTAGIWGAHPIDEHEELCPGALDKAREVCTQWDPSMLKFNPKVINAFQRASPGSKIFDTRLIELVAVALHQFGVILHQLEFRMHQGDVDAVINWTAPKTKYDGDDWEPIKPLPTLFNNPFYIDWKIYPEGAADMIGYWVEDRIFGGIVVFDRRAELDADGGLTGEPTNIYLHSSRYTVTSRVTQLLDEQQQSLLDFLLAKPDPAAAAPPVCPLPISVDDRNRTRVSPEGSLVLRGIYRDIWERRPLDRDEWNTARRRPQDQIDFPEIGVEALMFNRAAGLPFPEGELRDYLDGEGEILEGPTKRMLDEYKEIVDREKKRKLDAPEEGEDEEEDEAKVHIEGHIEQNWKRKKSYEETKAEAERMGAGVIEDTGSKEEMGEEVNSGDQVGNREATEDKDYEAGGRLNWGLNCFLNRTPSGLVMK